MVPTLFGDSFPEQEGFAGGEDHVFSSRGLLPGIRWYVTYRKPIEINSVFSNKSRTHKIRLKNKLTDYLTIYIKQKHMKRPPHVR